MDEEINGYVANNFQGFLIQRILHGSNYYL